MIIVKIELHSANTGKITPLGEMRISNTGDSSITDSLHSYDVEIMRKGSPTKVQRRGLVQNYPRNNYTVWELVKRALIAGLGKYPIHPGTPEEFDEQVMTINNIAATSGRVSSTTPNTSNVPSGDK
jgi:hypothetical protein